MGVKDPALLWLWCRLAAIAPVEPLAWETPYAKSEALRKKKKRNSHPGSEETNPTRNHEDTGSVPDLTQLVKDPALL